MPIDRSKIIPVPNSRFLKVKCPKCGAVRIVFSHSSTKVYCDNCGTLLVKPRGGKAEILGKILEVLE